MPIFHFKPQRRVEEVRAPSATAAAADRSPYILHPITMKVAAVTLLSLAPAAAFVQRPAFGAPSCESEQHEAAASEGP